jgi:hypothetical protein
LFVVWGFFSSSAEARGQVKEAAERLGGEYSGSLHPKCTHLVVQISLTRNIPFIQNSSAAMFVFRNSGYTMLASLTHSTASPAASSSTR